MKYISFLSFLLFSICINAQVSPPGLGDTNGASWFALGMKQDLNEKIESMTYVGLGLKSDEENYNITSKPAIIVINQEFYHQLDKHWKVSYALSYRKQMEYSMDDDIENISTQNEMRIYGRVAYSTSIGKVKLTQTVRQEARKFVDHHWKNTDEPIQLRSRLKSQISVPIDLENHHTITGGAEILFATNKHNLSKEWSRFKYKESRFTLFYTFRPQNTPLAISLGYMNNLIKKNATHSTHYASIDITWENPFKIFS